MTIDAPAVRVRTRTGMLIGRQRYGCFEFLGVPFAQAPVGPLAFVPPRALPGSDEVLECTSYGATPPQLTPASIVPLPTIDGPNCLNLNIWTPTLAGDGLPVFVWIPGGGYIWGSNASPWYDGTNFARDGVVFVAVNYRTGPEGCLFLGGDNVNRMLLDNLAALSWVQENIATFGGDPSRVTIGGQSVGGRTCLALYSSTAASGLFRRSISMSPGGAVPKTPAQAESLARQYAASAGVACTPDGLASIAPQRRQALNKGFVSLNPDRPIWREIVDHYHADSAVMWGPVQDGTFFDDLGYVAAAARHGNGDALLVGTTTEENTAMNAVRTASMTEEELGQALEVLGPGRAASQRYLAQARDPGSPAWAFGQAIVDWHYRVPIMRVAQRVAGAGRRAYRYEFRWRAPGPDPLPATSKHGADLLFAFDNLAADLVDRRLGSDPPQETAARMHAALVRFIGADSDPWPPYTAQAPTVMAFDTYSSLRTDVDRFLEQHWRGLDGAS